MRPGRSLSAAIARVVAARQELRSLPSLVSSRVRLKGSEVVVKGCARTTRSYIALTRSTRSIFFLFPCEINGTSRTLAKQRAKGKKGNVCSGNTKLTKVSYATTRVGEGERTTKVLSSLRVKSRSNYEHLATSAFTGQLNTPRCTRILYRRECTCVAPARETHKSLSVGLRRSNTESLKPCNFVELRIAPHHRGRHLMAAMRTEPAPSACTAVPSTHNFATHCSPLYGESTICSSYERATLLHYAR